MFKRITTEPLQKALAKRKKLYDLPEWVWSMTEIIYNELAQIDKDSLGDAIIDKGEEKSVNGDNCLTTNVLNQMSNLDHYREEFLKLRVAYIIYIWLYGQSNSLNTSPYCPDELLNKTLNLDYELYVELR